MNEQQDANKRNVSIFSFSAVAVALSLGLAGCTSTAPEQSAPAETAPSVEAEQDASDPQSTTPETAEPAPEEQAGEETETQTTARTPQGADLAVTVFEFTWQDAVAAALKNFDGQLKAVGVEWEADRYVYQVELVSATEEYEVSFDADTGEQVAVDLEALDAEDLATAQQKIVDREQVISWEDALKSALAAKAGTVNEWKLAGTLLGAEYDFEIIDAATGNDFEVTVNALTGDVTEIDD